MYMGIMQKLRQERHSTIQKRQTIITQSRGLRIHINYKSRTGNFAQQTVLDLVCNSR
jgi:hypothetical protein